MDKTKDITNPLVTEYINGFYQAPCRELMTLRLEAEEKGVPIILREAEDFFNTVIAMKKPKRILEIGTAVGYSAAYFAIKTGGQVITIEKDSDMYQIAKDNIEKLGLSSDIRLLLGDGEDVARSLSALGEAPVDLVFIDGAKSHYRRFFDGAFSLCRPGTVILSDNVLFGAKVVSDVYDMGRKHKTNIRRLREYLDFLYENPLLETSLVACGDGIAVSIVK